MDDEVLTEYAFVISSKYRVEILRFLDNGIETPTSLSEKIGFNYNSVSRALNELKKHGIVECINEEASKTRLYRVSSLGDEILGYMED